MLKHIVQSSCPNCGNDVIVEESVEKEMFSQKLRQHTNGGYFEHRLFACGQKISYIPNYGRTMLSDSHVCQNDIELIEKKRKRNESKEKLASMVDTLDVDEKFRERLKSAVQGVYVS